MKEHRIRRLFAEDNRIVIVAFDHAAFMGPVRGLEKPGQLIDDIVATGIDSVLTTMGIARTFCGKFGHLGLILRVDGGATMRSPKMGDIALSFSVQDALRLGADAVACMGMIGFDEEPSSLRNLAELSSQSAEWNMPLLAEMLVKGTDDGELTVEDVEFAMRIGVELGADLIKAPFVGPATDFTAAIQSCYCPVVVLGGAKMDEPTALLENVAEAIDAGATGVAIGRNVWQHPNPASVCRALVAIVHGGANVSQALKEIAD
jgi:class I fructose-bisphosphate aldolase